MPAQNRKKGKAKISATRVIALILAVILLGSILLAAALSNFGY